MNALKRFGAKIRVPALSISVALLVGAIFIIFTDIEVLGGLLSDPIGALSLGIGRAATAYSALFRGAFGDPDNIAKALASNGDIKLWSRALRPLVESVVASVPLIFVGLGVSAPASSILVVLVSTRWGPWVAPLPPWCSVRVLRLAQSRSSL